MAREPALDLGYLKAALPFDDDLLAAGAWRRFSAGVRFWRAGRPARAASGLEVA
jgi:hypothetical protein